MKQPNRVIFSNSQKRNRLDNEFVKKNSVKKIKNEMNSIHNVKKTKNRINKELTPHHIWQSRTQSHDSFINWVIKSVQVTQIS